MRTSCLTIAAALLAACATPEGAPRTQVPSTDEARPAERGGPVDLVAASADGASCRGETVTRGGQAFAALPDGGLAVLAPLRPVADGAPTAYHPRNDQGGAILHRCNAGEVILPDGTSYEGAASNRTCTDRFERDAGRIAEAGWTDGSVGAVRWHGLVAGGSARVGGQRVPRAVPAIREDGFHTSPTALEDADYAPAAPERYVDAGRVPYAAVRRDQDIPLGTFGVAWRVRGCRAGRTCEPVPFVVADHAPRAGAGSLALAHETSGLALPDRYDRSNRYRGQAGDGDVLTVFFGGPAHEGPLDEATLRGAASAAFEAWGGQDRLYRCRRAAIPALAG